MSKLTGVTFAASIAAAWLGYALHSDAADEAVVAPASHLEGGKVDDEPRELPPSKQWVDVATNTAVDSHFVASRELDGRYGAGPAVTLERVVITR